MMIFFYHTSEYYLVILRILLVDNHQRLFDFEGNYITAKIPVTKNLLKADSKVLIKLNLDKIHLFDNLTEEAIF